MAFSSSPFSFTVVLLFSISILHSASIDSPSDHQPLSMTAALLFPPILYNLSFTELSAAISNLSYTIHWSFPITLFAPANSSIPIPALKHHLAPGLFSSLYLSQLPLGSTIETTSPNRCLTLTSSDSDSTIFLDGVQIHLPDLYNDGRILIHGIRSPLFPSSCDRSSSSDIMIPMLRDAIVRLRSRGYGVLALAMKARWTELAGLDNMTVFAVEDRVVFRGEGRAYVGEVGLHMVPGRIMRYDDLVRLGEGTVMVTMERGRNLVVTESSGGAVKINYMPIKVPDAVWNGRIVVHGLWFPFPRLYLADLAIEEMEISSTSDGKCGVLGSASECYEMAPTAAPPASKTFQF